MAEQDQHDENDLDLSDDEAEQLLADAVADEDKADKPERSATDTDLKAQLEHWKRMSRKNEKSFKDTEAELKKYRDANKSESERLQEDRDSFKTRAERAESALRRREIAEQLAPEHATAKQIAQVAKRMTGDDDDALESDARELFEMLAPEPKAPKTPSRPKERLRGGSEPDEEPEETDPRKLAAMVPRRR